MEVRMTNRTVAVAMVVALGSGGLLLSACSRSPVAPSAAAGVSADTQSRGAGAGNTPAQLTAAGWQCEDVPGHGVHCLDPHASIGASVHMQVKVFDTGDPSSDAAPFLGTESLIRADQYKGQPCLPGHGEYFPLPFGYYACHHFDF
jgi:hypothetical protein